MNSYFNQGAPNGVSAFQGPQAAAPFQNAQTVPNGSQPFMNQNLFMQPVGNVYSLSVATDIDNVPVANQMLSLGLCMGERILHIKSLQNGVPMTLSYRLTPVDAKELEEQRRAEEAARATNIGALEQKFQKVTEGLSAEINSLKQQLSQQNQSKGSNTQWQI